MWCWKINQENVWRKVMIWRKYQGDAGIEYSASSGPVEFWIFGNDRNFNTIIHYGGHSESFVLTSIHDAKIYCKNRAIELIEETLNTLKSLDNSLE
jgi:hypothetical protein